MNNSSYFFNEDTCRFQLNASGKLSSIIENSTEPLSVILQITRRCHFSCAFCSETDFMKDPTVKVLERIESNLKNVDRIYLSGGEPLIRSDFPEVADIFYGKHLIGLPTNAVANDKLMKVIKNKIDFVNVGLDGPRNVTSRVRGDYDLIMEGIFRFIRNNIPFSLTAVVLNSTKDSISMTCQIADTLGAKKLKLVFPIYKGNATRLPENEFMTEEEGKRIFETIKADKQKYGWRTVITLTTWNAACEGYSILIYPNGESFAWPVYNQPDKVLFLGNLKEKTIQEIWNNYPYKYNHFNKYLGSGIYLA